MKIRHLIAIMLLAHSQAGAKAGFIDGDFQTNAPVPGNAVYDPTNTPYTFTGFAGLTTGNTTTGVSPFGNVGVNNAAAIIQYTSGNSGTFFQTFTAPGDAGIYTLSFLDKLREGYGTASAFNATVVNGNGTTFSFNLTDTSTSFTEVDLTNVFLTASSNRITFTSMQGLGSDTTTDIDNIAFSVVPEPASLILMGLGIVGAAIIRRPPGRGRMFRNLSPRPGIAGSVSRVG